MLTSLTWHSLYQYKVISIIVEHMITQEVSLVYLLASLHYFYRVYFLTDFVFGQRLVPVKGTIWSKTAKFPDDNFVMDAALVKFEHPLAKYRSTLSVDILGRSTCRPTLSWLTVKMSPDMLVNMLANMSTEGQWTYQSIGHPHSANTLMILGWLFF